MQLNFCLTQEKLYTKIGSSHLHLLLMNLFPPKIYVRLYNCLMRTTKQGCVFNAEQDLINKNMRDFEKSSNFLFLSLENNRLDS